MNPLGLRRTHPLGVFRDNDAIALIGREKYSSTYRLVFGYGNDRHFQLRDDSPSIVLPLGRKEHLEHISDVRISQVLDARVMTYSVNHDGTRELRVAIHEDAEEMDVWDVPAINHHLVGSGVLVSEYLHNGQYVLFFGEHDLHVAFSKNLVAWHTTGHAIASPRHDQFDRRGLKIISADYIERGLLVLYESREARRGQVTISIGSILFSGSEPEREISRSEAPLYQYTSRERDEVQVLGAIVHEREIILYLGTTAEKLVTVEIANPYKPRSRALQPTRLNRHPQNPILSPSAIEWESEAVFNPAAFVHDGRVHLLYRAMGPDGVSRIGYASSSDGIHFDERLPQPVYTPTEGFGTPSPDRVPANTPQVYDPITNPSGGGWAGCEDPRVVAIDGHAYMSFVAFDGWNFVRQALTSISLDNLNQKNWAWKKPVLISKPGETHKNWVIFPEKINGKYAVLHGLSPKIHIDYVDSLKDFDGGTFIDSLPPAGGAGYHDAARQAHWDNRVRGAGAPPLKTPMGWLLLYHANDKRDPGKYKLGAMLLDLEDPTKILYRCSEPILEPEEWYENEGKPGVVYTCGAVIINDNVVVYYGGGDKHIAVARANLEHFLNALTTNHAITLTRVSGVI